MQKIKNTKILLKYNNNFDFLTLTTKRVFSQLKKAFIKSLIFLYSNFKYQIFMETKSFSYDINIIFGQQKPKLNYWHYLAFFFSKIMLAKTKY